MGLVAAAGSPPAYIGTTVSVTLSLFARAARTASVAMTDLRIAAFPGNGTPKP